MQLDSVVGNSDVIHALKTSLIAGTLPHAILITAPDGCGRGFVSRCLAADYLFPDGGPGATAVMRSESSEVLLVEGEGRSGQIPIERIRNVRSDIFHSSLSAAGRVVFIKDAHKMAAPSANALLKVLEEPPSDALFILSARDASLLPQTIVSRCSLYPLSAIQHEECEAFLKNKTVASNDPSLSTLLSVVYGGRIGSCLDIINDENRHTILQNALFIANAALHQNSYAMLQKFAFYEGRADGDRESRDQLLSDITNIMAVSLRATAQHGIPAFSPTLAAILIPPINEARLRLRGNVSPKIVFASLVVQLIRIC